MESTPDGVEKIHAAEQAAQEKVEQAEQRARTIREEAEKESKIILQEAKESAKRDSTRILEGITTEANKIESEILKKTESGIEMMLKTAEEKKKEAVKGALKILLEEEG
jgi:vacuolar-type H+-ATPase subunit H